MAQAFIHIEFGGGGTDGGYLSIDGAKPIKLKNDMVFALNPGTHHFGFSNKSKASRAVSTGNALSGNLLTAYAMEHDAVDGEVTLSLDENDMAFFTIVSNNWGKVIALPTYTIGTLDAEQAAEADRLARALRGKRSRKKKRTIGIIMILCSVFGTNNAIHVPEGERNTEGIILFIAIGGIGLLLFILGLIKKKK